jgi:hypothetical protein
LGWRCDFFGIDCWGRHVGHSLLSRDVSGVPVVRALDGPMREQPVDPGGSQAAHQGLSVNNVAAQGTAQAPGDRLVLAPNSVDLTAEDAPLSSEAIDLAARTATRQNTDTQITAPKPIDLSGFATKSPTGVIQKDPIVAEGETYGPVRAVEGGLGKSLRPRLRPSASQVASAELPAAPAINDGSSLPAGTRLVQLGAFESAEIAQEQWQKLQSKFTAYLGDKELVVQKANSGGKVFYRLRAVGFSDLSDARRLCSALKAQNADCIPVVTR